MRPSHLPSQPLQSQPRRSHQRAGGSLDLLRRLLTPVVVVLAIASNAVRWNGVSPGDVAGERATVIDAAGFTFSIWGLIFALHVVWAIYTVLPRNRDNAHLQRTGWPALGVVAGGGLWPIVTAYGHHVAGTALILVMLALLVVVDVKGAGGSGRDYACARFGFSVERGWVVAAAVLAVVAVIEHDAGIAVSAHAGAVIVGGVFAVGVALLFLRGDPAATVVVAWALFGIAVDHGTHSAVGSAAFALAPLLLGIIAARSIVRALRMAPLPSQA